MKKLIIYVVAAFILISCSREKGFQISGYLTDFGSPISSTMLYLKTRNADEILVNIDSTFVKNDGSFILKGKSSDDDLFFLADKDNVFFLRVFVGKGNKIKVNGSATDFRNIKVEGSKLQALYDEYLSLFVEIEEQKETIYHNYSVYQQDASISEEQLEKIGEDLSLKLQQLEELGSKITIDFISANANSTVAAYLVYKNALSLSNTTEIEQQVRLLDPSMNNKFITSIKKHLDKLKQIELGKVFPNIELPDSDGNIISLESLRGKYVLVDFWATWCGPCVDLIPHLKKCYHDYHDKGFEIYSVSLDQNREAWINCIATNKLDWVNVSDLQAFNSPVVKQFVVNYIPHTFLLDRTGMIIAIDINGEDLEKLLLELLP